MARIVVVDYHKGNLMSVERGLSAAGADAFVSDDPVSIREADAVVLPGVGSFADAMAYMRESGQAEAVVESVRAGCPFWASALACSCYSTADKRALRAANGSKGLKSCAGRA